MTRILLFTVYFATSPFPVWINDSTPFVNRTLADALANESILDMQGITEALSRYYYKNGNSFHGISVVPEYQEAFDRLADAAIDYYN